MPCSALIVSFSRPLVWFSSILIVAYFVFATRYDAYRQMPPFGTATSSISLYRFSSAFGTAIRTHCTPLCSSMRTTGTLTTISIG